MSIKGVYQTSLATAFETALSAQIALREAQYKAQEAKRELVDEVMRAGWSDCLSVNMVLVQKRLRSGV